MTDPVRLADLEDVRAGVEHILAAHLAEQRRLYRSFGAADSSLADAVATMLSRGKRLRPTLCYWSFRAHGGAADSPERPHVLHVGAAIELFQAAALFHDDVMDASDTRRGSPTAHRAYAAQHAAAGWSGDPGRFGESVAILLGDLTLTASESELARALRGFPADAALAARAVFDVMRTEVMVGQYLDVLGQALPWGTDPAADEARAREVIRAKSARYSVEHPLVLGAALAGAGNPALAGMGRFGGPLGEAFQLRDDLLGVFGDPAVTGKPAGDDVREGKRTVLAARAMSLASRAERELLTSRLGDRSLDEDQVAEVVAVLAGTGAAAQVELLIDELLATALDRLDALDLDEPGAGVLRELARAVADRTA